MYNNTTKGKKVDYTYAYKLVFKSGHYSMHAYTINRATPIPDFTDTSSTKYCSC